MSAHGLGGEINDTPAAQGRRPARVAIMLALAHKIQQAIDPGCRERSARGSTNRWG
jgi:hypothetical protein